MQPTERDGGATEVHGEDSNRARDHSLCVSKMCGEIAGSMHHSKHCHSFAANAVGSPLTDDMHTISLENKLCEPLCRLRSSVLAVFGNLHFNRTANFCV